MFTFAKLGDAFAGGINFQSDFDTLQNKGSLDYLYVMASREFDKFCVLYFENLSIEDFRPLSPGARGKVSMKKFMGMKKCEVLHGEVIDKHDWGGSTLALRTAFPF